MYFATNRVCFVSDTHHGIRRMKNQHEIGCAGCRCLEQIYVFIHIAHKKYARATAATA